jgi:hypothetical protein
MSGRTQNLDAKETQVFVLDPDPNAGGKDGARVARAERGHMDHHATCPSAAEWKGKKR